MNLSDDDLNCLLKAWTAPRSPNCLEGRLRRAYRDRAGSRTTTGLRRWIAGFLPFAGKFAGVVAGAIVLLAVITRAFPQSLGFVAAPGAMIVDSEFLDYEDDGSSTVSEYRTSVSRIYGETTLSSSFPGDPLRTATVDLLNPVKAILDPVMHRMFDPLFYKPGRTSSVRAMEITVAARIRNGCTPSNMWGRPMTVIGKQSILNYSTTVSQFTPEGGNVRFTEWFAPGLDCLSLRSTTERATPGGAFQLASERRVLKVTTNSSYSRLPGAH